MLPHSVQGAHKEHIFRCCIVVLSEIILEMMEAYDKTYITLDALDEIREEERKSLLSPLNILVSMHLLGRRTLF